MFRSTDLRQFVRLINGLSNGSQEFISWYTDTKAIKNGEKRLGAQAIREFFLTLQFSELTIMSPEGMHSILHPVLGELTWRLGTHKDKNKFLNLWLENRLLLQWRSSSHPERVWMNPTCVSGDDIVAVGKVLIHSKDLISSEKQE